MAVCTLHHYNPRRSGKPVHYDSCGACRAAYEHFRRRQRWTGNERAVARRLGGHRNPGSGALTPGNRGDVTREGIGRLFSLIEARQRTAWDIAGWVRECRAKAPATGPWLLVVSKPGEGKRIAILDYDDLCSMLQDYLTSVTA